MTHRRPFIDKLRRWKKKKREAEKTFKKCDMLKRETDEYIIRVYEYTFCVKNHY